MQNFDKSHICSKNFGHSARIGNFTANVLTFLTTSWGLHWVISAALTSIFDTILAWVQQPYVYFSAGVFIFVLWTSIGIKVLFDARKPRIVRSLHDYAYALVCEGCTLARDEESDNGAFQIGINFRNFCNGPMKLKVTDFRVIIGDRTVAPPENISIMICQRSCKRILLILLLRKMLYPKSDW